MRPYDLILRNGTLIDPAAGLHARRDVAFAGGLVAAVGEDLAPGGAEVLDCAGRIVAPGLIDLHVHIYWGVSYLGIPADPHCIARGVTTAVDAGSAGADTFPGLRRYVIEASDTRLYAMLNIAAQGMLHADIGEFDDLRYSSVPRALATIEQHRDLILGVKVRLTRDTIVSAASGLRPLALAREAADAAGLPIMVHPQEAWCDSLDDILALMRGGDILTHCFHGSSHGILDERGRVRASARAAMERGVVFDVGHGAGSFSWEVAEQALAQGAAPQTISSDLHSYNVNGPVFDLITTAGKFLHLGMGLDDVLARVTAAPARAMGMAGRLGTLQAGAAGDAVVLALEEGAFPLIDSHGKERMAERRLTPTTVVRAGRVYLPGQGGRQA